MNKKELGLILARRMNITQVEAKRLTNALFDILMEEISSGVSVKISGFGAFISDQNCVVRSGEGSYSVQGKR